MIDIITDNDNHDDQLLMNKIRDEFHYKELAHRIDNRSTKMTQ